MVHVPGVSDVWDAGKKVVEGAVDVAEKAGGIVADIGTGGAYSAYKTQKKQKKAAKEQRRREEQAIAERKAQALAERKTQIDQQRERLVGNGQGTKGHNKSGIKAKVTTEERLG